MRCFVLAFSVLAFSSTCVFSAPLDLGELTDDQVEAEQAQPGDGAHGLTAILQRCQNGQKCVVFSSSSSSSHFSFPRDISGTIADTDIINKPPEPFRPTDVHFGGYKTETKDL